MTFSLYVFNNALKLKEIINNNNEERIKKTKHTKELTNFKDMFEFTINYSEHVKEFSYVGFMDKQGKFRLYQIINITNDFKNKEIIAEAEAFNLQLINKTFEEYKSEEQLTIKQYFDIFLTDTIFEVRFNEIEDNVRTLSWESEGTALSRILSVANSFSVELDYVAEFKNNTISKVYIDIRNKIGTRTNKTLNINSESLLDFKRNVSLNDFRTCLIPKGTYLEDTDKDLETVDKEEVLQTEEKSEIAKEYTDISEIEFDDGEFKTVKGENKIYAYVSNEKYRQNFKVVNGGYIDGVFEYDTESSEELFNRALIRLKEISEPRIDYETKVNTLNNYIDLNTLNLGDSFYIYDNTTDISLHLEARVVSLVIDYLDNNNSEVILSNYSYVVSRFTSSFADLRNQTLKNKVGLASKEKIMIIETDTTTTFLNGDIKAKLTARVLQGSTDITKSYNNTDFIWEKYNKNGKLDDEWTFNHKNTNNIDIDEKEDIFMFATYVCKIKDTNIRGEIKINNLMTTIASETEPLNPKTGQQWLDISKTPSILYMWDGKEWLNISEIILTEEELNKIKTDITNNLEPILNGKENAIFKQPNQPSKPFDGAIWINTSEVPNVAYRYDLEQNNWFKMSATESDEIITASGETLAKVLVHINQKITDDAIVDTVMKSKDLTEALEPLADKDDLINFIDKDVFDLLSEDQKDDLIEYFNENLDKSIMILKTEIEQLAEEIRLSASRSGGVNLIKNSIGLNKSNFWDSDTNKNVDKILSTFTQELKAYNMYSAFLLQTNLKSNFIRRMSQRIQVKKGFRYTISYLMKSSKASNNNIVLKEIDMNNKAKQIYQQKSVETGGFKKFTYTFITENDTEFIDIILSGEDESEMIVTALMFNIGYELEWQQHSTEFYTTNAIVDSNGFSVIKDTEDSFTQMTNESYLVYDVDDEGKVSKMVDVNSKLSKMQRLELNELIISDMVLKKVNTKDYQGIGIFILPTTNG